MRGCTCIWRDAGQLVLDRVLDRHHVARRRSAMRAERRVERRRLAAAGRAGDQHDAVASARATVVELRRSVDGGDAELAESRATLGAVEEAEHDALAARGRHDRDPHVDVAAADPDGDAAVLRQAALGDVEAGHDLHARRERRRRGGRGGASTSCSTPSIAEAHARACARRARRGRRWRAPCTASARSAFTRRMTGASSSASSRSGGSANASSGVGVELERAAELARAPRRPPARRARRRRRRARWRRGARPRARRAGATGRS